MIKKMNKETFINCLIKHTKYDEKTCGIINDILEKHFLVGRKNRKNIINDLKKSLSITEDAAITIYDISSKIIFDEIKNKLKHPFG